MFCGGYDENQQDDKGKVLNMAVNVDISSHNAVDESRRDQMRLRLCDGADEADTNPPCNLLRTTIAYSIGKDKSKSAKISHCFSILITPLVNSSLNQSLFDEGNYVTYIGFLTFIRSSVP